MKAAAFSSYGPPEVLRSAELPEPRAGAGEVRIRVKAAGVMPFDCRARKGEFPPALTGDFPVVPGNEFAGVVDQVGAGAEGFSVGDSVLGFSTLGSYAEYQVVSADQVVPKPADMPWEVAGAFSVAGQGAHMGLEQMRVQPGDTVLINGAAGGLGTASVQLARERGASTVIGTASEGNHDYLRSLGAVPVTYGEGLVDRIRAVAPDGVHASLCAHPEQIRASVAVTTDIDRVITMVYSDEAKRLGLRDWTGARTTARLEELLELYRGGAFRVHVRRTYPLDQAAEAHRDVGSGHGAGKVAILVD